MDISVYILSAGFHGNSSFCLGEEEEVEIEVQENFLSFEADLVAEQLTYMDAVSGGGAGPVLAACPASEGRRVTRATSLPYFLTVVVLI